MSTLLWLRKSLRLHDNPALCAAIEGSTHLFPVFCLDPWFVQSGRVGTNRMNFLLESLHDLDASLRALNSRLIVLQGDPRDELPRVWREWKVERLAFEIDTEEYAKARDDEISRLAQSMGVQVVTRWGHTMCDLDQLLKHAGGTPTTNYNSFLSHFEMESRLQPVKPIDAPRRLPPLGAIAAAEATLPSIDQLGYARSHRSVILPGGETEALRRLEEHLKREEWVATFEKPQTSPTGMNPFGDRTRSTTALSPYLKFGCLSSRLMYDEIKKVYARHPKHSKPPTSLHGQLLWREFYYTCAHGTPHFSQMRGNPICRQIPWGADEELLAAWREARTGYPWIDAAMTQLREEGWIHHLARHAVACFLTRGDLWQSWEEGAKVFDELLLDADPAINYGNWMWLSCSCFFYQYFRCYSPVAFPKKYDKEGEYVRHWLPCLKNMPAKYIYEPWKAPIAVQKSASCIVGVDYPKPIVQHEVVSKENMAKMAMAYEAYKNGKSSVGGLSTTMGAKGKNPLKQTILPSSKKPRQ